MKTLVEIAEGILKERSEKAIAASQEIQSERSAKMGFLLEEFEKGFKEQLPMLADAGIKWNARYNSMYDHEGAYIQFRLGEKTLKMDFGSATSYRYEYTGRVGSGTHGCMVYGDWPKDDFIIFIYNNLIKK